MQGRDWDSISTASVHHDPGLLLTLQTMPQHGVVLVFLDTTTKDQDLLDDVVALRDEKEIKIFVVYAPKMNTKVGSVGDPSWTVLNTVSEGRIYDMSEFNRTLFIEEVTQVKLETALGTKD